MPSTLELPEKTNNKLTPKAPKATQIDVIPLLAKTDDGRLVNPTVFELTSGNIDKSEIKRPENISFANLVMRHSSVSIQAMARMGFSGGLSISTSAKSHIYSYIQEIVCYAEVDNEIPSSSIKRVQWGAGIRLAVIGASIDGKLKINDPNGLAAATTLGLAHSSFVVQTIGIGLECLPALKPLINNPSGSFSLTEVEMLGGVFAKLSHLTTTAGKVEPMPIKVWAEGIPGNESHEELITHANSEIFALERAWRRDSCNQAIAELEKRGEIPGYPVSPDLVRDSYYNILSLRDDEIVTETARDIAIKVLQAGR